jgi:hypothetical protein
MKLLRRRLVSRIGKKLLKKSKVNKKTYKFTKRRYYKPNSFANLLSIYSSFRFRRALRII